MRAFYDYAVFSYLCRLSLRMWDGGDARVNERFQRLESLLNTLDRQSSVRFVDDAAYLPILGSANPSGIAYYLSRSRQIDESDVLSLSYRRRLRTSDAISLDEIERIVL